MPYLLDTHTFLWFVSGDKKLPKEIKELIKNVNEPCFISIASFWEITIKVQLGKLKLGLSIKELFEFTSRNKIEIIEINSEHLIELLNLPFIHRDPFDRLIISQGISEDLILISKDSELNKYGIKLIW
jgi:PIN domain nuclease of toxin-antitoxin system